MFVTCEQRQREMNAATSRTTIVPKNNKPSNNNYLPQKKPTTNDSEMQTLIEEPEDLDEQTLHYLKNTYDLNQDCKKELQATRKKCEYDIEELNLKWYNQEEEYSKAIKDLKTKSYYCEAEKKILLTKSSEIQQENLDAQSSLQTCEQTKQSVVANMKEQRDAVIQSHLKLLEITQNLESHIDTLQNETSSLVTENGTLSSKLNQLETTMIDMGENKNAMQSHIDTLQNETSSLSTENEALKTKITKLETELDEIRANENFKKRFVGVDDQFQSLFQVISNFVRLLNDKNTTKYQKDEISFELKAIDNRLQGIIANASFEDIEKLNDDAHKTFNEHMKPLLDHAVLQETKDQSMKCGNQTLSQSMNDWLHDKSDEDEYIFKTKTIVCMFGNGNNLVQSLEEGMTLVVHGITYEIVTIEGNFVALAQKQAKANVSFFKKLISLDDKYTALVYTCFRGLVLVAILFGAMSFVRELGQSFQSANLNPNSIARFMEHVPLQEVEPFNATLINDYIEHAPDRSDLYSSDPGFKLQYSNFNKDVKKRYLELREEFKQFDPFFGISKYFN